MTPLTKGSKRLMASEEKSALARCAAGRDESKMASVAEGGCAPPDGCAPAVAAAAALAADAAAALCEALRAASSGDVNPDRSGKDMDGREDVTEGTSSHFWDPVSLVSSAVSWRSSVGLVAWCEGMPDGSGNAYECE
jgi:hypothetical protein